MKAILLVILFCLFFAGPASAADYVAINKSGDVEVISGKQVRNSKERYLAIEKNRTVTLDGWGLDRINQRALPLDGFTDSFAGIGTKVYIVDSGVDKKFFDGRIYPGMSTWGTDPHTDCAGHGTAVAGIIAGEKYGVAPEASIIPVQAFTCMGFGSLETVLPALEWIRDNHRVGEPALLNASFGLTESPTLKILFRQLLDRGITIVASAGNSNKDACSRTPANIPDLITTAASNIDDVRASFSNWGDCVDLFAPGENIPSLAPQGSGVFSGTSFAAPHITGAMARILSLHKGLSSKSLYDTVLSNSTKNLISDPRSANKLLYLGSDIKIINHAPSNDSFLQAQLLRPGTLKGSSRDASVEEGEPNHGNSSLWFSLSLKRAKNIFISSKSSSFDSLLFLYKGGSLSEIKLVARGKSISQKKLRPGNYRVALTGRDSLGEFELLFRQTDFK